MPDEHMKMFNLISPRGKSNTINNKIPSCPSQKITNGAEDMGQRDPYTLLMPFI